MIEHHWQKIPGQAPSKSNTYRIVTINGHGSLAKTSALKAYENTFYLFVGPYRNMNIQGFFELEVRVYFTTLSHDLDNSLKVILDCLQSARVIRNDNRCVKVTAEKFLDRDDPRIEFRIIEV